ncbi:MAG: bifunctional metallophosphatase/5'-nucleotidase [Prevotella sp.]
MNRIYIIWAFLLLTLAGNAQDRKELVILHTNDTHSTIDPVKATVADTLLAGRGGVVRRANLIEMERKKTPGLLLFDSGDFSQGSPYYTMFKGVVEVGAMNAMGYNATTLGNHEFDNGMDNLAKLIRMANFPFVCSNYDFTGSPLEGLVKPWITLNRNGIKIGVFGLSPVLSGIVMEGAINGIKYIDPVKATQETAEYLKNVERCDLVICLSHVGWDLWPKDIDDSHIFNATRNVDLVLGGHSHTFMEGLEYITDLDGNQVPVDQNGNTGSFIGKVVVTMEPNCQK